MADYESSHTGQELDAAIDAVPLKQDKLPNASAVGQILKSTNTTGGMAWTTNTAITAVIEEEA